MITTNPMLLNRRPGHWKPLYNTDVECPFDRQVVNVQCWKCGWMRDRDERHITLLGLSEPIWHKYYVHQS